MRIFIQLSLLFASINSFRSRWPPTLSSRQFFRNRKAQSLTLLFPSHLRSLSITATDIQAATYEVAKQKQKEEEENPLSFKAMGLATPLVLRLESLGFTKPTEIQYASWLKARLSVSHGTAGTAGAVLMAPTGCGKTYAYLLPVLHSRACMEKGKHVGSGEPYKRTAIVVAPTRELAVQLASDIQKLLPLKSRVELAINRKHLPEFDKIFNAAFLIGTPFELLQALEGAGTHGRQFIDSIDAIVLDEVDVLLPVPREYGKFGVHGGGGRRFGNSFASSRKRKSNGHKRKNALPKTYTEKLLEFIALHDDKKQCLVYAGSATASRKSLDRINSVLRLCEINAGKIIEEKGGGWRGGLLESIRISSPHINELCQQDLTSCDDVGDNPSTKIGDGIDAGSDDDDDDDSDAGSDDDDGVENSQDEMTDASEDGISDHDSKKNILSNTKRDAGVGISDKNEDEDSSSAGSTSTAMAKPRYVLVPKEVKHRYALIDKKYIMDPNIVLGKISSLIKKMEPKSVLIFICGSFVDKDRIVSASRDKWRLTPTMAQPLLKQEFKQKNKKKMGKGGNGQHKDGKRKSHSKEEGGGGGSQTLSAQKACDFLRSFNIDAMPLHVALGLDGSTKIRYENNNLNHDPSETETHQVLQLHSDVSSQFKANRNQNENISEINIRTQPSTKPTIPCYVTFEGLARGLHFENVDMVFVIGRPSSVASYLHISGRVGRQTSRGVAHGTVVSMCSSGSAKELGSWAKQIGAHSFEELQVPSTTTSTNNTHSPFNML